MGIGFSKTQIFGRLGSDPDYREVGSDDTPLANLSIAVDITRRENGEYVDDTEWFDVSVWGRDARYVRDRGAKGALIYIEGRKRTDEYTDSNGNKRRSVEFRHSSALDVQVIDSPKQSPERELNEEASTPSREPRKAEAQSAGGGGIDPDDDIPF